MTIMTKLTREFFFHWRYKRTADAISIHVDSEDKGGGVLPTPYGNQQVTIRSVGFLNPTASNMSIYNAKQEIWLGWMCCVTLPHCKCSYSERSD